MKFNKTHPNIKTIKDFRCRHLSNILFESESLIKTVSSNKFLTFPNHYIRCVVTGKSVNRGIGLGLEMPVDYFFTETMDLSNGLKNP